MVTHDFTEAHFLSQRVAIINAGRIEQVGSVEGVFMRPATPFVAEFVGMKNIFAAIFNGRLAQVGKLSFQVSGQNSGRSRIAIRPEHIRLFKTRPEDGFPNLMEGIIAYIRNQGVYSDVGVNAGSLEFHAILTTSDLHTMQLYPGQRVFISVSPENIHAV